MKKRWWIILGVILGIVVVVAIFIMLFFTVILPGMRLPPATASPTIAPSTTSISSPEPPAPGITISAPTAGTQPAANQPAVNYSLFITNFGLSGISSAAITAQLSNSGSVDAHNAWARVELFSQGNRIKIGGQDYYRKDIGTIKAGETITTQVTISVNLTDAPKIMQNGATVNLTIISDEKTQTFTYNYP